MSNKLQAKDLINLGLFTVLYFVIGCCVAIPVGFVPIFLPILGALWSLITGIPFMLFLTRVKKLRTLNSLRTIKERRSKLMRTIIIKNKLKKVNKKHPNKIIGTE